MSLLRRAAFAASVLAALALAPLLVRIGMADRLAAQSPQAALAWWPQHGPALAALAQQQVATAPERAATTARSLLERNALAGSSYRVLAQLAMARGDEAVAATMFRNAARRTPRDRVAHAWLVNHEALHGNFSVAIAHLDELLRMAPGLLPELSPALASFTAMPEARNALLQHLGKHATPWRASFLDWFAGQPESAPLLSAVFAPLRAARQPLLAHERGAWVERLLRDARVGEAYYVWVDGLTPEQRRHLGNVFDGGFELPDSGSGFGWSLGRVPGASIQRDGASGAEGEHALIVAFHDRRVPFAHVQQRLALAPGAYRLNGRVRVDGLRNERGLHWVLSCNAGQRLAETARFTGTSPWRDFEAAFEVPAANCQGQLLQLRLAARIAPEQMVGGRILFDALSIRRNTD